MKDHTGDTRKFLYWREGHLLLPEHCVAEVHFGLYSPDGGASGEMAMQWYRLGGNVAPTLEIFDDAWSALATMPDLIAALGERDDQNITPQAFCELLLSLGFVDDEEV